MLVLYVKFYQTDFEVVKEEWILKTGLIAQLYSNKNPFG